MQLVVGFIGLVAMLGAALSICYVISYAVLFLVGKALPLAGRRRR
ncbi:MAG TPA: hypothetical protein VGI12_09675 [Vicinamibacterales bacterium]|jgi:hypothetical protein